MHRLTLVTTSSYINQQETMYLMTSHSVFSQGCSLPDSESKSLALTHMHMCYQVHQIGQTEIHLKAKVLDSDYQPTSKHNAYVSVSGNGTRQIRY